MIGIREFAKAYKLEYSLWDSAKILMVFFPYQLLLAIASVRAVARLVYKKNYWEKTVHVNAHRDMFGTLQPVYAYVKNAA
jgi:hypothetical protein